ncbi:hypothetical protein ACFOOM_13740 [Streptomyces echinoruber]|nr:hypothetical protein [Streptomyces echinoruber]
MIKETPEMTGTVVEHEPAEQSVQAPSSTATDERLIAMLVDCARTDGLRLTGEGGLPRQPTKRVLESGPVSVAVTRAWPGVPFMSQRVLPGGEFGACELDVSPPARHERVSSRAVG